MTNGKSVIKGQNMKRKFQTAAVVSIAGNNTF